MGQGSGLAGFHDSGSGVEGFHGSGVWNRGVPWVRGLE